MRGLLDFALDSAPCCRGFPTNANEGLGLFRDAGIHLLFYCFSNRQAFFLEKKNTIHHLLIENL